MGWLEIICGLILLLILFYYRAIKPLQYWKKHGMPGPEPTLLFGNFLPLILGKVSLGDQVTKYYRQYQHLPVFGMYLRSDRVLVVNDPDVIQTILIKDFSKFASRGLALNKSMEPLSQHLFSLEPKRWRPLRARLSPTFTSGKLKEMFSMIIECSNTFEKYIGTLVADGKPIDVREMCARFSTDVIGTCAFGVDTNAMSTEKNKFREIGKTFFGTSLTQRIRIQLREGLPTLYTLLGYILPRDDMTRFFTKVVNDMIDYRRTNNVVRHDFINTLMDLQDHPEKLSINLTDDLLVAQAFVFFVAGFETSASTIAIALYELAQNQDIQDRLREEINQHHDMNNGEWLYEGIKKMPILDAVLKESLRKFPPLPVIMRKSCEDYYFESLKLKIPKDTRVFIPVYGIHRNPEFYPNPEVFDINRFNEEAVKARHPMHYLPFGDGPRNCIGARFAIFQTKIGLIKVIKNYKVDVCEETQIPYINESKTFVLAPKGGKLILKVTKLTE